MTQLTFGCSVSTWKLGGFVLLNPFTHHVRIHKPTPFTVILHKHFIANNTAALNVQLPQVGFMAEIGQ